MRNIDVSLYLVTDRNMITNRTLPDLVHEAVKNGVTAVQLREKKCSIREFILQAIDLKKLLDPLHVPLIINDRVDVALAADASGVHLGQNDMPVSIARKLLGNDKVIGLSVETENDMINANALDVDYLGISPIFKTPTKTDTVSEWGLNGLRKISELSDYDLVAIGGINEENAVSVMENGADGIAVVSAICASDDPGRAASTLRKAVDSVEKAEFQKQEE